MENPRLISYRILYNVLYRGAYSNIEMNKAFRQYALNDRDRGFITELVYGTLERKIYLEYILSKFSKMPIHKMSNELRSILLMGIYQICYMDSVKNFAAVDESVKLCKKIFPKGSGFVNGILRNILRDENAFDIQIKDPIKYRSVRYAVSEDIIKIFIDSYGLQETDRICKALQEKPKMFLRVNRLKTDGKKLHQILSEGGIESYRIESEPNALLVKGFKNLEKHIAYTEGLFTVQDLSSMKAVRSLDPKEGETVLDLCSCPGGKTTFIAELMNDRGNISARDISANKLELVEKNCKRLGIHIVETKTGDATVFDDLSEERFDRVLVDAPCSGLGIIRKKPEIRYKTREDIESLYEIQKKILENGARYVKPGGILLYSTCTVNKKENEDQIQNFLLKHKFELIEEQLILFENGESDGFYIAKMKKTEKE